MTETAESLITPAGDPFFAAAKDSCSRCFRRYLTITIEEDDEKIYVAIPCKRAASQLW